MLLKLRDDGVEIGVTTTQAPREPVTAACRDSLAIRDHVELTGFAGRRHGVDAEAPLDEGHETRDLGPVVLSRRTVHDLDLHPDLLPSQCSRLTGGASAARRFSRNEELGHSRSMHGSESEDKAWNCDSSATPDRKSS
jgi:hypothetical protein